MKILVTGSAGFIGFHLVKRLVESGHSVLGLDDLNDYYDVGLKYGRLNQLGFSSQRLPYGELLPAVKHDSRFVRIDVADKNSVDGLFKSEHFDLVCHLAAQAGVRYSVENPHAYTRSNVEGFLNVLEGCRNHGPTALCYASSSSVYGRSTDLPFAESHSVDKPASLYAATKKANELMADAYAHLYGLDAIGLRFFTVYGPWGRPDMAIYRFTKAILDGEEIQLYNYGHMKRDFTFVSDIVDGVMLSIENLQTTTEPGRARVYNLGYGKSIPLLDFVTAIERASGRVARVRRVAMQPGDVEATWADTTAIRREIGYKPVVAVDEGVREFVEWYRTWTATADR